MLLVAAWLPATFVFASETLAPRHDINATAETVAVGTSQAAFATGGLVKPKPTAGDRGGRNRIGEESAAQAVPAVAAGPAVAALGHVEDQRTLVEGQGRSVSREVVGHDDQIAEAAAIRDGTALADAARGCPSLRHRRRPDY